MSETPNIEKLAEVLEVNGGPSRFFVKNKFLPEVLARKLATQERFIASPIDDGGKAVRLLVYENGVFQNGESLARSLALRLLADLASPRHIDDTAALLRETTKLDEKKLNPRAQDLINVENGMLDWRTGNLLPHSPDFLATFQISAAWDPNAQSSIVAQFLSDVFPPDAISLAEEMVGYLLLPTTKHQVAFTLVGAGANGKSTFLSALIGLLGRKNVSHVALQELGENRFVAAELLGKLANIYPDLPSKALEQSDIFKAVVSGDFIKAERKFAHPFTLCPTARLLFSANELPHSKDLTHGFFRRWRIIPFPNKFEGNSADKGMLEKLTTSEARSAWLSRAVIGLRRLETQQGFADCASVRAASEHYRSQCDSVFEFAQERLQGQADGVLGKKEVYEAYSQWCEESGVKHPSSTRRFNDRLEQVAGVKEDRKLSDGKKRRVWRGVAWKDDGDVDHQPSLGLGPDGPGRPGTSYFPPPGTCALELFEEKLEEPGPSGPTRSPDLAEALKRVQAVFPGARVVSRGDARPQNEK